MKILIVDDSDLIRIMLKKILIELGHVNILEAVDGLQAQLVLSYNQDVKLAFVDWNMPNINGFDLLRTIKKVPELKHILVIMVTIDTGKADVVKAIKSGASSYIIKPFTSEIIAEKISHVLTQEKLFALKIRKDH